MQNHEPIYSPDADWVDNKKIKLFVATPVHSEVSIHYMQSVFKLQAKCNEKKNTYYVTTYEILFSNTRS